MARRRSARADRASGRAAERPPAPAPATGPSRGFYAWAALALVVLAAGAIHAGALSAPFFADDYLFLDLVRHRGPVDAVSAPDPLGNFFRPIGRAVHFWIVARAGGESPVAFHAVNVALFLAAVALLFAIARRLAGPRAAAIAAGFLALTHAADVPVLWASGSQDLIALAGALAAIALHQRGHTRPAAIALLVGLLAKETVALAPIAAVAVARRADEPWRAAARRAAPLAVVTAVWALAYVGAALGRTAPAAALALEPAGPAAALAQLARTALGLEWRAERPWGPLATAPAVLPLALAALAVLIAALAPRLPHPAARAGARRAMGAGALWAACGALPVAAVAPIWSAYYHLFALAGVGLALGGLLARAPVALAALAVVALGWCAEGARRLDEFATAPGAWSAQSHVNRFYVERAMARVDRYLGALRRRLPDPAPGTTLFYAGLPSFVAFQAGDGPLVRWAYRDSSLRAHYVNDFTRARARRGPFLVLVAEGDSLRALPDDALLLYNIAYGALLSDRAATAREAIELRIERAPDDAEARRWGGYLAWATGDRVAAREHLARAGLAPRAGGEAEVAAARVQLARGDTLGAIRRMESVVRAHALDAGALGFLADLLLASPDPPSEAAIAAFASLHLDSTAAWPWWRWGYLQAMHGRSDQAAASLERYLARGGHDPLTDDAARRLLAAVRRELPGGDLARRSLRE